MREIKFRAWDNHYKYMNYKIIVGIYGNWEDVKDDKNYTACSMWVEPEKVDYKCEPHWTHFEPYHKDIKLMQYTGLDDKNGKEIYEGDIAKYENMIGKIMFFNGSFILSDFEETEEWELGVINEELEIMGDIYNNPELLEGE